MTLKQIITLLVFMLAPALGAQAQLEAGKKFSDPLRSGDSGPQMVLLPTGSFVLGGGRAGEDNAGVVRFEYRIAFGVTEVTAGQFLKFLESSRSDRAKHYRSINPDLPAGGVNFDEAEAYVNWLSRESGHYYRLPSASEWEYAARAGTKTTWHWGDEVGKNNANCMDCGSDQSGRMAQVGSFPANAWGLHDMHGNVWEWAKDCVDPNSAPPPNGMPKLFGNCDLRELRGGSAFSDAWAIRSSVRTFDSRNSRNEDAGFRVVMENPE